MRTVERLAVRRKTSRKGKKSGAPVMGHAATAAGSEQTGVTQSVNKFCGGLTAVTRVVEEASGVVAVTKVAVTTRYQTSSGRRARTSRPGIGAEGW